MRNPSPLPRELHSQPFSVADARTYGLGPERLRRRDLAAPFFGIRAPIGSEETLTLEDIQTKHDDPRYWETVRRLVIARSHALNRRMGLRLAFSHLTAAQIHGLYLPNRLAEDLTLHVTTERAALRPKLEGVRNHLFPEGRAKIVVVDGIRVTSPLETWCTLASLLSLESTVVIGDQLVQRQDPIANIKELEHAVKSHAGRHGAKRLRLALPLIRANTDSPMETKLRLRIINAGLPEPRVNIPIKNRHGVSLRLGDLVYPHLKVLVEYDGWRHRDDVTQYQRDIEVLQEAAEDGWRVIRIHKGMLENGSTLAVHQIRSALVAQGWKP
ncbi:MAG: hypothetical protein KF844_07250 [Cryobacterium sp.]|nr:hypothetical protein [Cryobacterium sp.]